MYIDDVLAWGTTREEHDKQLSMALEVALCKGPTLNPKKCVFGVEEWNPTWSQTVKVCFAGANTIKQESCTTDAWVRNALRDVSNLS